jgi:hypothetical protein
MHNRSAITTIRSFLIILATLFILTGCVKADYHITLQSNGSATIDYLLAVDKLVLATSSQSDPFADLRTKAIQDGYLVIDYEDETHEGLRMRKTISDVEGAKFSTLNNELFDQADDLTLTTQRSLLTREFQIDTVLDLRNQQQDLFSSVMSSAMYSQADIKLRVTLPITPKSHNANQVSEDGKTLTWNIMLGQANPLQLNVVIPNLWTIGLIAGVVILLIMSVLIVWLIIRNKNRRVPSV